jgi:arginyl-tRNA synthetase
LSGNIPGGPTKNEIRKQIEDINEKIYNRSDKEINRLYDLGRKWSLEYFEEIYKKLDTKFDKYFFESEAAKGGTNIVKENPNIFTESDGAIIFKGEDSGLHTRVFINSQGLPTYEAKELGLNKTKFELYPDLDLSIIITGNEINDYFKVLLKVMELIIPEVAHKTRHIGHGMLRLPTGKMSSRTGDVITADSLIEKTVEALKEKETNPLDDRSREMIAIGAIKYSILKQSPGRDVVFDFDKSLSVEGDSGPYLQYAYARLNSILTKSEIKLSPKFDKTKLVEKSELDLIRHLIEFPEVVGSAGLNIAPQYLALYLYKLADLSNSFYEKVRILTDEDKDRMLARLKLIETVANTLKSGLSYLGIKTLPKI